MVFQAGLSVLFECLILWFLGVFTIVFKPKPSALVSHVDTISKNKKCIFSMDIYYPFKTGVSDLFYLPWSPKRGPGKKYFFTIQILNAGTTLFKQTSKLSPLEAIFSFQSDSNYL